MNTEKFPEVIEESNYDVNELLGRWAFPGRVRAFVENMDQEVATQGLTKREYFAGLAMLGLVASKAKRSATKYEYGNEVALNIDEIARKAIHISDELLEQLKKK
jgi:hypothetical protein